MTRSAFSLQHRDERGGAPTVTVSGEVDVTNAAEFADSLAKLAARQPIILDLSPLAYFDSAGFAALDRACRGHSIALVISPHSPIRKAAVVMALQFYDNVGSADRVLRA